MSDVEDVRSVQSVEHYRVPQRSGDYCDADGEDWPCEYVRNENDR